MVHCSCAEIGYDQKASSSFFTLKSVLHRASAALWDELMPKYMDSDAVRVVIGDAAVTQDLLKSKFDHIFFTGTARYLCLHILVA